MKKIGLIAGITAIIAFAAACGNDSKPAAAPATNEPSAEAQAAEETAPANDPKGIGKYTSIELTNPLDQKMVADGQKVYDVKCASCHKITDEKVVGPGWKDVTKRRKPEWIMNFVTNTDEMLSKDAEAMSMLEVCLVRMPNQNLSEAEARSILEFMRHNDGEK